MRTRALIAAIVFVLIALTAFVLPWPVTAQEIVVAQPSAMIAPSPPATSTTITEIVTRSPYSGTFTGSDGIQIPNTNLSFWLENGKVKGRYTSPNSRQALTGSNPDGPVMWLEIKGGQITFETQSGASYILRLTKDGKIVGTSRAKRGFAVGHHVFEPTQAQK